MRVTKFKFDSYKCWWFGGEDKAVYIYRCWIIIIRMKASSGNQRNGTILVY